MKRRVGRGGRAKGEPPEEGRGAGGAPGEGGAPRARAGKKRPAGDGAGKGGRRRPGVCPYCGHEEFDQLVVEQRVAGISVSTHELDFARCGRCQKQFNWKTGAPHQENVDRMTMAAVAFLVALVAVFLLTRRH